MRRLLRRTSALIAAGILAAGCSPTTATTDAPAGQADSATTADDADLTPAAVLADNADYTRVDPDDWDEADALDVTLAGASASTDADAVTVDGSTVTITAPGVYRLSGTLEGRVVVDAGEDALVVLILDGATLDNSEGAAISVATADDVAIHLADGSTNSVSDADSYADDADAKAAIHADADLTISGDGALIVHGNGNDGISTTDDLTVLAGTITVTAADDALRGKDALVVEGGTLDLTTTGGDGLASDGDDDEEPADIDWTRGYIHVAGGTIDVTSGDDGLQAFTDTVITGGTVSVDVADDGVKGEVTVAIGRLEAAEDPSVTVTSSTEAVEAANIRIESGVVDLTASDDGVNASGNADLQELVDGTDTAEDSGATDDAEASDDPAQQGGAGMFADTGERLEIAGGEVTIDAEGDGIDSNGTLTITGGDIAVYGPTRGGDGSLDANGGITMTGGTLVAFGPGDMEEVPGTDGQGWVQIRADLAAGESARLVDDDGAVVADVTSRKTAGSLTYSSADIETGATYSLTSDGETLGSAVAGEGGMAGGPGGQGGPGGEPPAGRPGEGEPPADRPGNGEPPTGRPDGGEPPAGGPAGDDSGTQATSGEQAARASD